MPQRYNTGNSRPSNSMKDLNDNALAFDDYMNSDGDTFIDRFEKERDSLYGTTKKIISAANVAVEETRQNLIPLSRQYMTLADAQADIANIPEGSTTYVRSPDGGTLADEYINNGGTLAATGRAMPSMTALDTLVENLTYAATEAGQALDVGKTGSYSRLVYHGSVEGMKASSQRFRKILIDTIQTAPAEDATHSSRIMDLAFNVNGVRIARRVFPPRGAQIASRTLYSHSSVYRISDLKGAQVRYTDGTNTSDISEDYSAEAKMVLVKYVRADNVSLPLNGAGYKSVLDMKGVFSPEPSYKPPLEREDMAVSMGGYNGAGCIQFFIPVSILEDSGISPSDARAIYNFVENKARHSVFSYWTFSWTPVTGIDDVLAVLVPPGAMTVDFLSAEGGLGGVIVKVYEEDAHTEVDVGEFLRLSCDVKNASTKDYLNYPVELKVRFPPGRVPSQDCLILTDHNGVIYPCQFAGATHPNARFRSRLGYHPDGSLAAGSVFCMADIPAGQTLFFELRAYSTARNTNGSLPGLTPAGVGNSQITVDGFTLKFTLQNDVWSLSTITDPATTVHRVTYGSWVCGSTFSAGSYAEKPFDRGSSLRLINTGPVFTELETVAFSPAVDSLPGKAVRSVVRYRLFRNGKLQIKTVHSMEVGLPVSVLSGVITRMNFGDAEYPFDKPSATLFFTDATSGDNWGVSVIRANGDQHRDGETYGPLRPVYVTALSPSNTSRRIYAGWKFPTQNASSFVNWPVNDGWAWTVEHWVDMKVGLTNPQSILSRAINRPVGFLGESSYPSVIVRKILSEIEDHVDGSMDWWYSGDAKSMGGGSGTSRTFSYAPVTYDILRYLRDGVGSLDTIYNRLAAIASVFGVPTLGDIGSRYLSGNHLLQFASRITVPVLHWLYRVAVLKDNTTVRDNVKAAIKSFADAIVTHYNANGGVNLNGSATGVGNSNSNATGLRIVAMGIMTGQDTSGAYLATYNGIESLLMNSTGFMSTENVLKEGAKDTLTSNWWIHYQVFAYNNYLFGCTAADKSPAFDMRNLLIQSASPVGGFDEVDYCISESRRGSFNTLSFAAYPMLLSKSASMMNALSASIQLFSAEYGPQPGLPRRYFGFDGYQADANTTTDVAFVATTFSDLWIDQYFRQRKLD